MSALGQQELNLLFYTLQLIFDKLIDCVKVYNKVEQISISWSSISFKYEYHSMKCIVLQKSSFGTGI